MSVIRVLPESISNRIAAGEVIERPASVVKELMENSIDAAANKISVAIEDFGLKLIFVSDNGIGMDADDALLCLEPHATSKISAVEDIGKINTLGFRGEALPSIASVARMKIKTRARNASEGTEVICEGGKMLSVKPTGCAVGTEMLVRDLFFNTPARKKFLCASGTEEKHISDVFTAISLAHHDISFSLTIDAREIYVVPACADLRPRIRTLLGKNVEENLIRIEPVEIEGIKISGYMAKHGYSRPSRKEQRVYVNYRPVETFCVYNSIRDAYGGLVPEGRFPPVILFIELDPARVDVNVHPAKREVRFREPRIVSSVITKTLGEVLRNSQTPTVFMPEQLPLRSVLAGAAVSYVPKKNQPDLPHIQKIPDKPEFKVVPPPISAFVEHENKSQSPQIYKKEQKQEQQPGNDADKSLEAQGQFTDQFDFRLLGFSGDTYIVADSKEGLIVIDQHAAHERVLYEKLLEGAKAKNKTSQTLLIPVMVELSTSEANLLSKNMPLFESLGFDIEPYGNNCFAVNAIPQALRQDNVGGLICDMVSSLSDEYRAGVTINEANIAKAACSHAIKAHDRIDFEEAKGLLRQLANCKLPFSCPHGRPTIINISFSELEKRFGRKK